MSAEQLAIFASCVWEPNDIVEWRALQADQTPRQGWAQASELPRLADTLAELNREGRNIYAAVNPRQRAGDDTSDSVACCRTLFVDFDKIQLADGETIEEHVWFRILDAGLPPATMMVQSGPSGGHAYWRLREPINPADFTTYQKRLIATLDSDSAIHDPARIMRLPGFDNVKAKYPKPYPCEILRHDASRIYDICDIAVKLKDLPAPEPVTATSTGRTATLLEARGRATLYAAKWQGEPEGSRNRTAFLHAKQLLNDFDIDERSALEILTDWNASNQPPLDEAELRSVVESAKKGTSDHTRGCKLNTAPPRVTGSLSPHEIEQADFECRRTTQTMEPGQDGPVSTQPRPRRSKAVTLVQPAQAVGTLLEDTITGRRRAIDWPVCDVGEITEALLPGTTTVLCGPKAVSKTFFLLQCFIFWMLHRTKCAFLVLEESVEHCLWRCLAQLAGLPGLTKTSWVRSHPDLSRNAWNEHRETLDLLGAQLYDSPKDEMTLPEISEWIRARGREGCRIVMADPITAAKQTDSPWRTDTTFINEIKRHATEHGFSAILATHPVKGGSAIPSLDSLAGSTAWARFAQTVLWLEAHDPKAVEVMLMENRTTIKMNRTMHVLAARNDWGTGKRIAMEFTEKLLFESKGIILKTEKKGKPCHE